MIEVIKSGEMVVVMLTERKGFALTPTEAIKVALELKRAAEEIQRRKADGNTKDHP